MSGYCRVILLGRLGADPELRTTQKDTIASLRVATTDTWTDGAGERQERTEWHQVSVWGRQAEVCSRHLSKGRQVLIDGRLQSREYEKDGVTRRVWEVVASNVVFVGDGGSRGTAAPPEQSRPAPEARQEAPAPRSTTRRNEGTFDDDPIPF